MPLVAKSKFTPSASSDSGSISSGSFSIPPSCPRLRLALAGDDGDGVADETWSGSRPHFATSSRRLAYISLPRGAWPPEENTTSAQRPAKRWPRPLWPAWMTTGWPWLERGTVNGPRELEELSLVIEPLDLGRIGEAAALLVDDQRAVFPGVPVAEHDLHEFVGAVVAQVMLEMLGAAHIVRFAVIDRGDDVPGGAAMGHEIEGGEAARHIERLEIGGRAGGAEAEPVGHHPHRGQHQDRVHLHAADAVFDGVGVVVAVAVGHRQPVVEKRHVKFSGFENPRDLLIVFRRGEIRARFRMAPRARQVGAVLRLQEANHRHLPCHAASPYQADIQIDAAIPYPCASARNLSQVASSTSMPSRRRSCSRIYSISPG